MVRSAPDLTRFVPREPDPALRRGKRYLAAYLGVMGPQDGVDYALRALAHLRHELRPRRPAHHLHGRRRRLRRPWSRWPGELGLDDCVEFTGRVSDEFVQRCLSTADVCLSPDPQNPLNDVSTMNKVVEYMAMGRPIVSFDLDEARVSAGEAAVYATADDERGVRRAASTSCSTIRTGAPRWAHRPGPGRPTGCPGTRPGATCWSSTGG